MFPKRRKIETSMFHRTGTDRYEYFTEKLTKILGDLIIKKNNVISTNFVRGNFNFLQIVHHSAFRRNISKEIL